MALRFYNTLTRREEEFRSQNPDSRKVSLYCCGPTVYNFAHIGNFRVMIFYDLLRRHLEARGYEVVHAMNITDVEDKIIRTVQETGKSLQDITRRYEKAFLEDFDALGCLRPKIIPRATEHMDDIIEFIRQLQQKNFAYQAEDGSVYFSIKKFASYGMLSRLDRSQLQPGTRVVQDEHPREAYGDFALWKAYCAQDGSVAWESPWGRGRPGWHIECSCMSIKHLGETIDIHCGGEDLIFPHHEDEIAQSEAVTGKPFVRFWLHLAHLLVNGQKMSKSAGNFFTFRDLIAKGYTGREIRYALLSAHYRLPLNFTLESLEASRQALRRLDAWEERLRQFAGEERDAPQGESPLYESFLEALDADLNISDGLGLLFESLRNSNRQLDQNQLSKKDATRILKAWEDIQKVLGLPSKNVMEMPVDIMNLAREREKARQAREWKRSDEIRDILRQRGWAIKDSAEGFKLEPL